MKRELLAVVPALALAATLALPLAAPAGAQTAGVGPGGVIALQGTEHLWGVTPQGSPFFIGDTRPSLTSTWTGISGPT